MISTKLQVVFQLRMVTISWSWARRFLSPSNSKKSMSDYNGGSFKHFGKSHFQSLPLRTFSVLGSALLPLQYRLFFQAFLTVASSLSRLRTFSWQTNILHERENWDWKVDLTVYHPKYINCELCTLAVIIYTINKIHLVAKQHLSLILDLSGGIWPLDLRNLKVYPVCRTYLL